MTTALAETVSLTALIDHAAAALCGARNSAEVMESYHLAREAYAQAKRMKAMAKAKKAHDELIDAVHRTQADALKIKAEAQRRLADEYDAAQERGEVASNGQHAALPDGKSTATITDIGLTHKAIHEARLVRDAEKNQPGIVANVLDDAVAEGREPMVRTLRTALRSAAGRGGKPKPTERDREIAEIKLAGMMVSLKRQWSATPILARRRFLRDIGFTDTDAIERAIRLDFKNRKLSTGNGIDWKLAKISDLPKLSAP